MQAAEKLVRRCGLTGVVIVATDVHPDGCTGSYSAVAGNRFAAIGAADAWLRGCNAYDEAYKAEAGRYDAVVHRQNRQNIDPDD